MKKMLALLLALMMLHLPVLSLAESFDNLDDMIGGSDLMLEETPTEAPVAARQEGERRINTVISIKELTGVQTGDDTVDAAFRICWTRWAFAFPSRAARARWPWCSPGRRC